MNVLIFSKFIFLWTFYVNDINYQFTINCCDISKIIILLFPCLAYVVYYKRPAKSALSAVASLLSLIANYTTDVENISVYVLKMFC